MAFSVSVVVARRDLVSCDRSRRWRRPGVVAVFFFALRLFFVVILKHFREALWKADAREAHMSLAG